MKIGNISSGGTGDGYFHGKIDDIRLYNDDLTYSEIQSLYNENGWDPLQNGLVAYYPFNANANDESGNDNNGTVNGANLTTDRFGNANSTYDFDGINDYISVNHDASLNLSNQITMHGWIYPESVTGSI